jgi:hypothetical protein
MIFDLLVTAFLFGLVILLGVLGVLRGLYRSHIFEPPDMPGDSAGDLPLDDGHDKERFQAYLCQR